MIGAWYDVFVPGASTVEDAIAKSAAFAKGTTESIIEAKKKAAAKDVARMARAAGEAKAEQEIERRTAEVKAAAQEQAYKGGFAGMLVVGLALGGLLLLFRK